MSKIIAIGDIHGLDTWKEIVDQEFDRCVFVGDYFDSFDVNTATQLQNFKDIVEFKKEHEDKVVLLTGNHDLHYILDGERYSGYQHHFAIDIGEAIKEAMPHLKRAHLEEGLLFSHAGVTKTWAAANEVDVTNIAESINRLHIEAFGFNELRDKSMCGGHKSQGPMWVRPDSLREDAVDGFIQVVGHTRHKSIIIEEKFTFIDSLWVDKYLTVIDGQRYEKSIRG